MKKRPSSPHALSLALLLCLVSTTQAFFDPNIGRWANRDPIGELGGKNLLYGNCANDLVNRVDIFGLVDFEFVIIQNQTGPNQGNNSGPWGSPGTYFKGVQSTIPGKSASTTITGTGPVKGWCCNTVISKQVPANGNAGSIVVYMKDADPGTYSVVVTFSGNAAITIGPLGTTAGTAGAVLKFFGSDPTPALLGSVKVNPNGTGTLNWSDLKGAAVLATIGSKSDRIQIATYDLTMSRNHCDSLTVTATGSISIDKQTKIK